MARARLPDLSLTEWAVLAVVAEAPAHGFAIAKELAPTGDLGRIWTVPRPLVYRALNTLTQRHLVEPLGTEAGQRGPNRVPVRATRAGRSAVERWLYAPVPHVRELRTRLLLQLRLLDRRGIDVRPLAAAQLTELTPILAALNNQTTTTSGFDHLLAVWRHESACAAVRVLEDLIVQVPAPAPPHHDPDPPTGSSAPSSRKGREPKHA